MRGEGGSYAANDEGTQASPPALTRWAHTASTARDRSMPDASKLTGSAGAEGCMRSTGGRFPVLDAAALPAAALSPPPTVPCVRLLMSPSGRRTLACWPLPCEARPLSAGPPVAPPSPPL
eukprot:4862102-Prymnesium_polylepis.1